MKKILFVCYGGGHVQMVLAVARELTRRGIADLAILGLTSARIDVEAAGFECLGFADFVEDGDEEVLARGEQLARGLQTLVTDQRESAAYLGLSFADLVAANGIEIAEALYAAHGRYLFLPVPTMERIIRRVGASVVVTTSAPRAERAAILAARLCGIPSLCMVDLFAAYEIEWLKHPNFADAICVLNQRVKSKLVSAGRSNDQVLITGNPAFDRIANPSVRAQGVALRIARGWCDKKVVLWASQIEPENHPANPGRGDPMLPGRIADVLRSLLPRQLDIELVVRWHPSEKPVVQSLQPREWLSSRNEDLHVLLHAVDVVVVMTSTVGIEAQLAGCHVIQVLGSLYSPDAPYFEYGIADQAVDLNRLPEEVLAAPVRRGTGEPPLLQAAAHVVDEVLKLIS
jgi:hypothetical protein